MIINLKNLTAEAFGYSPLQRFQLPPPQELGNDALQRSRFQQPGPLGKPEQAVAHPATPELHGSAGFGLLGLPAFCRVVFQPVRTDAGLFEGLELVDPIITVQQPQNIVTTAITGRRGTVKEYIGAGDFAVTIRGILATDPFSENRFEYPLPQVQALRDMIALGIALPVSGWLLDVYGIKNLVIQNPTYESLPGFTNLQAYELQCLSDEPIELTL